MSAGTLTLTNNSAAVSGSGTAFTTELAGGDFAVVTVGGIPYTLPVKTVNSNTSLTLVSNFTGPTQSGAAWSAVPRVALNMVTAALVTQSAEALRGLNYDKQNWQQVFSGAGTITVRLPDGTTFTGPSWKYLADNMATKINGAVPLDQGGLGSTTPEGGRKTLGLGSAATANATIDKLMPGVNSENLFSAKSIGMTVARHIDNFSDTTLIGFGRYTGSTMNKPQGQGVGLQLQFDTTPSTTWFVWTTDGRAFIQTAHAQNGTYNWHEVYTTANTTKSSDGTLKSASPVARIVKSQEENQRMDVDKNGFAWCGCGTANEEAEGISISRQETGVYVLTGSSGLASQGWQLIPPMDPGGMGELGIVEGEETESGEITIRLFRRKYMMIDDGEIIKVKGEPIDVPVCSWIDVRMDMPEDSAWNRKQAEANNGSDIPDGAGI
ncbi:phage tail fiber protein [Citrobacter portucalensis]